MREGRRARAKEKGRAADRASGPPSRLLPRRTTFAAAPIFRGRGARLIRPGRNCRVRVRAVARFLTALGWELVLVYGLALAFVGRDVMWG